jgi:hypothetical protein
LMCFGIETAKSFDGAVIATQNAIYVFSNWAASLSNWAAKTIRKQMRCLRIKLQVHLMEL